MILLGRALGWLLFGTGVLLFIATGGFRGVREGNIVTMVGGVLMPVGMIVTLVCTTMANWRALRRRSSRSSEPDTPKPADGPQKQYKLRPLDRSKLPPSPPEPP